VRLTLVVRLSRANPVGVLINESAQASVLALGSRQLEAFGSSVLGSVSAAVATRSHARAVVGARPDGRPEMHGHADRGGRRCPDRDRQRGQSSCAEPRRGQHQAAAYRADLAAAGDLVSQLGELARLRDAGVLSFEEFNAAKAKLLV
jgi:hypothetical protein